jgi:hypothetical protein
VPPLDSAQRLSLRWPRWYPLSADDRLKEAQAVATLTSAGQLSRESAVKMIAASHSISDVEAELNAIGQDAAMTDDVNESEDWRARAETAEAALSLAQAEAQARLIRAELKAEALRAGMVDLDGLKLLISTR